MSRSPRLTHAYEGDLVVFLIGMRVHQPWRLATVGRVFGAMPKMLVELETNRAAAARGEAEDLGYLGGRTLLDGRGPTLLQHWRSVEHLHRFAADPDLAHRPAWRDFYTWAAKAPQAVTIWHETYAVPAGRHESVYVGPARFGLAALEGTVPVARRGERARERMAG